MELIGNTTIMKQIYIAMNSAREDNRSTPHMLFSGAAGCGKTSTAKYLAEISGSDLINVACDSIKKRTDVLALIEKLNHEGYSKRGERKGKLRPSIVFIDEIHGLSLAAQEYLGILMEEWYIPLSNKETVKLPVDELIARIKSMQSKNKNDTVNAKHHIRWSPAFTLVGATTNDGKLSKPFRDRCKLRFVFSPYNLEESAAIVKVHAERLKISIDDEAAATIANRGRGVPRVLIGLLEMCRDMAYQCNDKLVTKALTDVAFHSAGIDRSGLTKPDIKMLQILYELESPVGIDNIAVQLNESSIVLSETVEPYLIQRGFIIRASKGRMITPKGRQYLIENGHVKIDESEVYYDIPIGFDRGM